MTITHQILGNRLREARDAMGMSQAEASEALGKSRPTISMIEAGDRKVTSVELAKLARLYGRSMGDFLAEEFDAANVLNSLFRANLGEDVKPLMLEAARDCLEIGRQARNLERLLGITRPGGGGPPLRTLEPAGTRPEALEQAEVAAIEERSRLGLGVSPLPDLVDLFEAQGVCVAQIELPEGVDGLTLFPQELGPFIVVNAKEEYHTRRRFSFAHEYAHVLFDQQEQGLISHRGIRSEPREVRANAFAGAFLLPAEGVKRLLAVMGKSKVASESNEIQAADIVLISHHFGASYSAVLCRLEDLEYLNPQERIRLEGARKDGSMYKLEKLLFSTPSNAGKNEPEAFRHRFLGLTLEALRREEISWGKGKELARLVGLDEDAFWNLCDEAGLEQEPHDCILPAHLGG